MSFLEDLPVGMLFYFPERPKQLYESRGNGWYSSLTRYDGGPWHDRDAVVTQTYIYSVPKKEAPNANP
jgi:hypothetical protein